MQNQVMNMLSFPRAFHVFFDTYRRIRLAETSPLSLSEQKESWAKEALATVNLKTTQKGEPSGQRPTLFVGNHISYLDIPVLLSLVPDLSFVAKKELEKWPIFGAGAKKLETIFVQRNCPEKRNAAKETLRHSIETENRGIAIFPAGTTSLREKFPWKYGAFRLAAETGVPMQAFRLSYRPLKKSAYIDDDFFPSHLLRICEGNVIHGQVEFSKPFFVKNAEAACRKWNLWCKSKFSF